MTHVFCSTQQAFSASQNTIKGFQIFFDEYIHVSCGLYSVFVELRDACDLLYCLQHVDVEDAEMQVNNQIDNFLVMIDNYCKGNFLVLLKTRFIYYVFIDTSKRSECSIVDFFSLLWLQLGLAHLANWCADDLTLFINSFP